MQPVTAQSDYLLDLCLEIKIIKYPQQANKRAKPPTMNSEVSKKKTLFYSDKIIRF